MSINVRAGNPIAQENDLLTRAQHGDELAFEQMVRLWQKPLFAYLYRIVTHREDAEDLLQEALLRAFEGLSTCPPGMCIRTWLFSLATRVSVDHLRRSRRWRPEAHLIPEYDESAEPAMLERLYEAVEQPGFVFEIREHIAFCFSCVARSLPIEQQTAVMLSDVFEFGGEESAAILGVSEDEMRRAHIGGRAAMIETYKELCGLINEDGRCAQCQSLREWVPSAHRGADLERITVKSGVPVTPETLFDARLKIVREADLEEGRSRTFHRWFFEGLTHQESGSV